MRTHLRSFLCYQLALILLILSRKGDIYVLIIVLFNVAFWDERGCGRIPAEREMLSGFGNPEPVNKKRRGCSFFSLSFDETVSISSWRPGSVAKPHEQLNEGQRMSGLLIDSSASSHYSGPRWSAA